MPRPKRPRCVDARPPQTWFKPAGVLLKDLSEVVLSLDELEAIRLADMEGLYQEHAAEKMNVSRQTLGRILESAHHKIAEALVLGKAIRLQGGTIMDDQERKTNLTPGFGRGQGLGRGMGPGGGQGARKGGGGGRGRGGGRGQGRGQGAGSSQTQGTGQGLGRGRGQGRGTFQKD